MLKKIGLVVLILIAIIIFININKKQTTLERLQEPISMDELDALLDKTTSAPVENIARTANPQAIGEQPQAVSLSRPLKPSDKQIQAALAAAGFYKGAIDGKIGAKTRKAIEDFQKAKGLKVDAKVGPKTWEVLSKYLKP